MKIKFQLNYWPVLLAGWLLMTFTISYIIAVASNNVHPLFPYISDMGAWQPTSTVFGQLMNIAALLTAITAYIRYHQVNSAINSSECNLSKKWNKIALWLAFAISLGQSIVGNFQGDIKGNYGVFGMHLIGAVMAFGIGGIYLAIQVKITFGLRPYYKKYTQFGVSLFIQYFRLISTLIFFVNLLMVVVFALLTPRESNGYRLQGLIPGEDGYSVHMVSVISEWLLAIILILNLIFIRNEFKAILFDGIHFKQAKSMPI